MINKNSHPSRLSAPPPPTQCLQMMNIIVNSNHYLFLKMDMRDQIVRTIMTPCCILTGAMIIKRSAKRLGTKEASLLQTTQPETINISRDNTCRKILIFASCVVQAFCKAR